MYGYKAPYVVCQCVCRVSCILFCLFFSRTASINVVFNLTENMPVVVSKRINAISLLATMKACYFDRSSSGL